MTGTTAGYAKRSIDGFGLVHHKAFDEMSKQELKTYQNKGKKYYKDYLLGTTVHKDGYGDIYFNKENAGKNRAHAMELYPQLKQQLKNSKYGSTSNDKGETDRYYEHLLNEYNGKELEHLIEVFTNGRSYKMTKFK